MADLSTLDATAPAGTDAVSGGDDAIRATRDAVKTSFGGTDSGTGTQASEHFLKGFHKFPMGNQAAKPTAGNAGRIYVDTTLGYIERDTGSAWAMLNAMQVWQTTGSLVTGISSSAWKNIATVTPVLTVAGARVLVYGMLDAVPSVAAYLICRMMLNSTIVEPSVTGYNFYNALPTGGGMIVGFGYGVPGAGSHTITLEAKTSTGTAQAIGGLIVLVV